MKQGQFITLEGGDGAGKSTNLFFVKQLLEKSNINVVITREPGGTVVAEKIRKLLLDENEETISEQAELLLMFAARAQHIHHIIKPALAQGKWVLCDRFTDSTYAYQGGGRGMDGKLIELLENKVQSGLTPDLTLLLDVQVETGMDRVNKRAGLDRFESEKKLFFEKVRSAYLTRAENNPQQIKVIDASQSLKKVQKDIVQIVSVFSDRI
ncbi:MAG: dTMP kinase [Methylococcales symbiont of Iophon sp. n. MRB-2018]|nr:MAG: dTMP kinase [Methylococcales symbiont of Iophon sp. n. MRB-2018]KAF3979000.1 MAG: dTMP kinase [Methylococcales symbiont of Iophon sp. n. MRB-2018]